MSEVVNSSLRTVAKGTGIVFFGTVAGMGLQLLGRVLLARFFTQTEYGIFSLAFVLLNIFVIISLLGLHQGSTRQIAYYRGKGDTAKVQGIVTSSLQVAVIASILISAILFFTSGIISTNIFHEPELSTPLKIFSLALPFLVLIHIFSSLFQGFGEVKPRAYFQNILRSGLFPLLLAPVILLGLSFSAAMYAFSASIIFACIAFAIYTIKKARFSAKREKRLVLYPVGKKLMLFSIPLLGVTMLNMIMAWTDTLMLGYFKTSEIVGLYNGALPLAKVISIFLSSMGVIFVPVISQFYSQNLTGEIKRNYIVLTKWTFTGAFPLFLLFFAFPDIILNFLFGSQYIKADVALRILALGYFIHIFLGPNGATLMCMGKTRLLMWASLSSAILNILFNATLIPILGITGAAISSAAALTLANIIQSIKLYQISRIHPFTKNYLKPIAISVVIVFIIYAITQSLLTVTIWMLPLFFVFFLVIYGSTLLLSKSFDREDITILSQIENRLGVDFRLMKKFLRRFLQ